MPAARAIAAAGLALLALAASVTVPALAWAALLADVLIVAAIVVDARRADAVTVRARRTWPSLLVQGTPATLEVQLSASATVVLVAREALHPGVAEAPRRQRFELPNGGPARWAIQFVPRHRGEHEIGPLTVRVLGPWRFAWSQRQVLPAERRRVYPQTRWQGAVGRLLALAHRRELGRTPLRAHGAGTEPYALREYRPGDPPSRIQWKASARHGRLLSREDTWERGTRLVVLLDAARAMTTRHEGRSKLDHALAAALALVRVAAGRGDRATLIAFSDRVERLVRVGTGPRGVPAAYAGLYDLQPRLTEPAYDLAVEAVTRAEPRRAVVVVLTSVVDLAAAEMLRAALLRLRRRHRPLLVNLQDPDLMRLALGVPASAAEAFAKVSAVEILLANGRLGKRLRRGGIAVVAASADQLAWRTLQAYLGAVAGASAPQRRSAQSDGHAPPTGSISEPSGS